MTSKRIYVASHSSLDIISTLNQFERYGGQHQVTIVVSSTAENLQFLQHVGVPPAALRFLQIESRRSDRKRSVAKRLGELRAEKRMLDELIAEIRAHPSNEFILQSQDDPHLGYVAAQLVRTNPVTLINILGLQRERLATRELFSKRGIKNLVHHQLMNLIFGKLYMLGGTPSYPMLVLDPRRVRLRTEPKSAGGTLPTLEKYRYRIPAAPRSAFVLYADSFGISESRHVSAYRDVLDRLTAAGFHIFIKIHPQSQRPEFLDAYPIDYVPKYIPFEFVDLSGISVVIGLWGGSLLCTGEIPTVSIIKLLYEESSDHYRGAMAQLAQNPAIRFVSSSEELGALLRSLDSPAYVRSTAQSGKD